MRGERIGPNESEPSSDNESKANEGSAAAPMDLLTGIRYANLALRFLLELSALAALCYWGF